MTVAIIEACLGDIDTETVSKTGCLGKQQLLRRHEGHYMHVEHAGRGWAGSVRGSHGIAVLQVARQVVLEVGRRLLHPRLLAAMGLLMWRLRKLRVKLLPLCRALLRLLALLLLERC